MFRSGTFFSRSSSQLESRWTCTNLSLLLVSGKPSQHGCEGISTKDHQSAHKNPQPGSGGPNHRRCLSELDRRGAEDPLVDRLPNETGEFWVWTDKQHRRRPGPGRDPEGYVTRTSVLCFLASCNGNRAKKKKKSRNRFVKTTRSELWTRGCAWHLFTWHTPFTGGLGCLKSMICCSNSTKPETIKKTKRPFVSHLCCYFIE